MKEATNPTSNYAEWKQEAGPLRPYLVDPTITEIMVNSWERIFIERKGLIEEAEYKFKSADALMQFVQSLCAFIGREINRKYPYLDARLPDGSRVNIVIPPVALDGPAITIRKAAGKQLDYRALVQAGAMTDKLVYFLNQAVSDRQNIVISGGTGSGKTTVLMVLSSFIGTKERVISIEDTAEIQLNIKNFVRMETRAEIGNDEPITMNALLRNALRMRPDRILIGECRGAEALDMLMAMNTGHEGSMTTVHANTAHDALRRLESMVLRSGIEAPLSMIQNDIASTIHFVVQVERSFDGRRRIVEVLEVNGRENEEYNTQAVFHFDSKLGIVSTGYIPKFVTQSMNPKVKFPDGFFAPDFAVKLSAG